MAIYAGDTQRPVLIGYLGQNLLIRLRKIIHPQFLYQLWSIGGLTGETSATGFHPRGINCKLIPHHVCMASWFVVLDPEPPSIKEQCHVREFRKFVICDSICIKALLILAFAGGFRFRCLL